MKKLLEFCLKWRLLVFAFVIIVATVGVRSATQLPIDAVPDITNVQVQVLTNVPALGPVDVERTITFPVESAMSGLPDIEEIRSVSRFGLSAVTIVFDEGTDLLRARQLISERLVQARERLPLGASDLPVRGARRENVRRGRSGHRRVLHADGTSFPPRLVHCLRAPVGTRSRGGELLRRRAQNL